MRVDSDLVSLYYSDRQSAHKWIYSGSERTENAVEEDKRCSKFSSDLLKHFTSLEVSVRARQGYKEGVSLVF